MSYKSGLVEYYMTEEIQNRFAFKYYPGPIGLVYNKKGDLERICSYDRKGRHPTAIVGFLKEEKENPFGLPPEIMEKLS